MSYIQNIVHNLKLIKHRIADSKYMRFGVLSILLLPKIRHIHGLLKIDYDNDELIIICVLLNGELYIKSFMEHYRSMGIKHFVFMDNGSTDQTIKILSSYDSVTILQSKAPYQRYENTMKRYLVDRFSKGRWNLCADIDELFDYPFSDRISLKNFLQYLNKNSYTAVITQMLDMFSDQPLAKLQSSSDDSIKDKYRYYDISSISKEEYYHSEPKLKNIKMHWGGIRSKLFGTNNGLTKASLVRMDGKIKTFVVAHHTKNAHVADVSCVLKHYPFNSAFYTKVKDAVQTGRYGPITTPEYFAYWKGLESNPNLGLKMETAHFLSSLEQLIDQEFISVSEQYREWVNQNS